MVNLKIYKDVIIEVAKRDVVGPKMVTHPHGQQKADIPNSVNGKNLYCIANRQKSVSVKSNEQERRNAQNLPSNEQRFKIAGKNNDVIAREKEKNCVKKSLVALFPMQVISAVHHH